MVYYKPQSNLELTSKLGLPQPHICTSEVPYLNLIRLPQITYLIFIPQANLKTYLRIHMYPKPSKDGSAIDSNDISPMLHIHSRHRL